jgi:hypothetical protein
MLLIAANCATLAERFHLPLNPGPLTGMKGLMIGLVIYFMPGAVGAWLAVSLAGRIKARFLK